MILSVLYCCTFNAVRSPMAEGIMKKFYGESIFVDSVGVHVGKLDPFILEVMQEIEVDMRNHKPKSFEHLSGQSFDYVISLSPNAQHKAVELTRYMACELLFWNTFNPTYIEGSREVRLEAYRNVRDTLIKKISNYFDSI
ncbi:MAG: low molecular weight phosphatase family protein [Alphaproteobacteria bacterium TMED87]|nr:low molecular weight phosphatase family protein [Rhodospirillaceae bacterium]OUV08445.1 MAG: low molecular weight phosphatase family protein [Alphaproteobacteria bacterium TMED87]